MFKKPSSIVLYNTAAKRLAALRPLHSPLVKIYTCGPTLYQPVHIGNLRAYVFADTLRRTLLFFGYHPKYIINLTDVGHLTDDADEGEDKVEKQAQASHSTVKDIVNTMKKCFFIDLQRLNIPLQAYSFPKATNYIQEQIALAKTLVTKGYAYETSDGLYFDTSAFKSYGALGDFNKSEKKAGARVAVLEEKHNANDFALWKKTPSGVKRQQEWQSPWGLGFPGWHIECSAMAMHLLGETVDIHTGGIDHISIHHNNEIAQSEAATGKPFATIWMHNAFLHNNHGGKLSKSLQNSYTLNDLLEKEFHPLSLRYLFLISSYRSPLAFSFESLAAAQSALLRLNKEYFQLPYSFFASPDTQTKKTLDEAFANDLNTAKAIAILWGLLKDKNIAPSMKRATIKYADKVLGILSLKLKKITAIPKDIQVLFEKRNKARKSKDYDSADQLRKQIENQGYLIQDNDGGSRVVKNK